MLLMGVLLNDPAGFFDSSPGLKEIAGYESTNQSVMEEMYEKEKSFVDVMWFIGFDPGELFGQKTGPDGGSGFIEF
jgi:hypothetical protein